VNIYSLVQNSSNFEAAAAVCGHSLPHIHRLFCASALNMFSFLLIFVLFFWTVTLLPVCYGCCIVAKCLSLLSRQYRHIYSVSIIVYFCLSVLSFANYCYLCVLWAMLPESNKWMNELSNKNVIQILVLVICVRFDRSPFFYFSYLFTCTLYELRLSTSK